MSMNQTDEPRPRGLARRSTVGFTLIEVMCVMVIMVIAILGFVSGLGASVQDLSASGESFHALNAARSKVEELRGQPFGRLYADYGPGSGGETFAVPYQENGKTLTLQNPNGGNAGSIIFAVNETSIPADFRWVAAYDLNGDGDTGDVDVSADYKILPVLVRVRWRDAYGPRVSDVRTVLFDPKYP